MALSLMELCNADKSALAPVVGGLMGVYPIYTACDTSALRSTQTLRTDLEQYAELCAS
jgi:hypothetical protein